MSAPSGIWNGRVRQLMPTSSGPARWMSIGYQPTPTEFVEMRGRRALLEMRRYVLLDHGAQSLDAPRLADVGKLREAVRRAHDVGPQLELGRAEPIAFGGRLRLHPVQEPEADALGVLQGRRHLVARGDR